MASIQEPVIAAEDQGSTPPLTAMILGHVDLSHSEFITHFQKRVDRAFQAGQNFIVSNSPGADTMALDYLLSHHVPPSHITVFLLDLKSAEGQKNADFEAASTFSREGCQLAIVRGGWTDHTAREVEMTPVSDHDILWVRGEDEMKELRGPSYQMGHVSGTQKNVIRRKSQLDHMSGEERRPLQERLTVANPSH